MKKRLSLLLAILMLVSLFTACKKGDETTTTGSVQTDVPGTSQTGEKPIEPDEPVLSKAETVEKLLFSYPGAMGELMSTYAPKEWNLLGISLSDMAFNPAGTVGDSIIFPDVNIAYNKYDSEGAGVELSVSDGSEKISAKLDFTEDTLFVSLPEMSESYLYADAEALGTFIGTLLAQEEGAVEALDSLTALFEKLEEVFGMLEQYKNKIFSDENITLEKSSVVVGGITIPDADKYSLTIKGADFVQLFKDVAGKLGEAVEVDLDEEGAEAIKDAEAKVEVYAKDGRLVKYAINTEFEDDIDFDDEADLESITYDITCEVVYTDGGFEMKTNTVVKQDGAVKLENPTAAKFSMKDGKLEFSAKSESKAADDDDDAINGAINGAVVFSATDIEMTVEGTYSDNDFDADVNIRMGSEDMEIELPFSVKCTLTDDKVSYELGVDTVFAGLDVEYTLGISFENDASLSAPDYDSADGINIIDEINADVPGEKFTQFMNDVSEAAQNSEIISGLMQMFAQTGPNYDNDFDYDYEGELDTSATAEAVVNNLNAGCEYILENEIQAIYLNGDGTADIGTIIEASFEGNTITAGNLTITIDDDYTATIFGYEFSVETYESDETGDIVIWFVSDECDMELTYYSDDTGEVLEVYEYAEFYFENGNMYLDSGDGYEELSFSIQPELELDGWTGTCAIDGIEYSYHVMY